VCLRDDNGIFFIVIDWNLANRPNDVFIRFGHSGVFMPHSM